MAQTKRTPPKTVNAARTQRVNRRRSIETPAKDAVRAISENSFDVGPLLRRNADQIVRPPKTASLVARSIVHQITSRQLKPGDMLPGEREMLIEYSVGRGTLREALRLLEMQGVITIRPGPGGGPIVSRPDPRFLASTLSMVLEFAGTSFRAIVETRLVIEPAVAALAAKNVDKEHLGEIQKSVERLSANIGNLGVFLDENKHFHDLIAWSSGNTVFGYMLSTMHWINDGTVMGVQYPEWAQKVVAKAHQRIYEAIASGDVERSRDAMAAHSQEYVRYLDEKYPDLLDQTIRWDRLT